jgi:hypothetical protein
VIQRVDQGQVVIGDQPRRRRQLLPGQSGPSRAAPQLVLAVQAMIGEDRVDPVLRRGPQPHQHHPVAQQPPQLPHLARGDPRLGQQIGTQQLRQGTASTRSSFSRADAIALHRDGCARCGASSQSSSSSSSHHPYAASKATGVPAGSSSSSPTSSGEPFGTLRLNRSLPSGSSTATRDRLRCTSIPA